jgi:glutathione S-transferase
MIELWGRKNSYNVLKVLWALAELKIDYSHHDVGSNAGDLETPEFLAMNPHARIPVLVDKGSVIWESNTIVRYLCGTYGENLLWTDDPIQRSFADRWMDWELATLEPDFMGLFWGFYRKPESKRDYAQIEKSKSNCERHFRMLDDHLKKNDYLAGTVFSMGDIPVATYLYRYFEMGVEVEKPANVMAWYQRLSDRQAFRQTIMTPFNELEGREQY